MMLRIVNYENGNKIEMNNVRPACVNVDVVAHTHTEHA